MFGTIICVLSLLKLQSIEGCLWSINNYKDITYTHTCYHVIPVLTFGFVLAQHNINESAGSVNLSVHFSGHAGEFVPHVNVSTFDGTATGNLSITNTSMCPCNFIVVHSDLCADR